MDYTHLLPIELFEFIFDILNDNINIVAVALAHVNKNLHKIISKYANKKFLDKRPDCKYAVSTNNLELLKWAMSLSFPLTYESCIVAVMNNNLDMLKIIFDNENNKNALWHIEIIETATQRGYLDIVKWIFDIIDRKEIDSFLCNEKYRPTFVNNLCDYAAFSGNLELLKFLKEKNYPLRFLTYEQAALGGHVHILEWLKEHNCEKGFRTYIYAMMNGNIKILEWLKQNNHTFDSRSDLCRHAVEKGSIELLEWANNNGSPWNAETISDAVTSNNLEIIKWLKNKGCPWNESACTNCAIQGYLHILKWLRENGCPWNNKVIKYARKYEYGDMEKWALGNGCADYIE